MPQSGTTLMCSFITYYKCTQNNQRPLVVTPLQSGPFLKGTRDRVPAVSDCQNSVQMQVALETAQAMRRQLLHGNEIQFCFIYNLAAISHKVPTSL